MREVVGDEIRVREMPGEINGCEWSSGDARADGFVEPDARLAGVGLVRRNGWGHGPTLAAAGVETAEGTGFAKFPHFACDAAEGCDDGFTPTCLRSV